MTPARLVFFLISFGFCQGSVLLNISNDEISVAPYLSSQQPVVLHTLPLVRRWVAESIFSEQYLMDHMTHIRGGKRYQSNNTLYYRYGSALEDERPDHCLMDGCWVQPESLGAVPTPHFFRMLRNRSSVVYTSWDLSDEAAKLLVGVDQIVPAQFFLKESTAVSLWIAGAGVTTTLHYDYPHNVYFQLTGRKRWSLYHVNRVDELPYFPFSGPHNRGVYEDLMGDMEPDYVFDLSPGETLVLPPMMLHRVQCLDTPCISANVWFVDEQHSRIRAALDFNQWYVSRTSTSLRKAVHALPETVRFSALKGLLLSSIRHLLKAGTETATTMTTTEPTEWIQRYMLSSFAPLYTRKKEYTSCDVDIDAGDIESLMKKWNPNRFANAIRKKLDRVEDQGPKNIILSETFEKLALAVVGAQQLPQFMYCMGQ